MEYWTAFTIGILGSLHCVGMCGPIALTLPYQAKSKAGTLLNILLYNTGRSMSYMLIGIIPGLLGWSVFISGYQKSLSVGIGLLLIVIALFSFNMEKQIVKIPFYIRFNSWLHNQFTRQLQKNNRFTFLSIGWLNGFLPCGLVYMGVAGALTQSSIFGGIGYMFFFGLGTFPLMLALSISGNRMTFKFRSILLKVFPLLLFCFGLLFIWRGYGIQLPEDVSYWLLSGMQGMCW